MNIIYFPSIKLKLNISKIAFSIFGITIYKYAICIVVGMIVALVICKINEKKYSYKYEDILHVFMFSIIIGIIGARLYFVIFNLKYYSSDLLNIINIRDGGLAIYGGLISSGVYIYCYCKRRNINTLDFLDYIIPSVAIAQSIGRWGNFFNVEAYGYQTNSLFRMGIFSADGYIEVHPTFLYESIATFIIFIILEIMQNRKKFDRNNRNDWNDRNEGNDRNFGNDMNDGNKGNEGKERNGRDDKNEGKEGNGRDDKNEGKEGKIFYTYCILYSFVRFFVEGLRSDSLMLLGFRVSQIVSLVIFIFIWGRLSNWGRLLMDIFVH